MTPNDYLDAAELGELAKLSRTYRDREARMHRAYAEKLRVACIGCGNALHADTDHPVNDDGDTLCLLCTCQRYMPPSQP